MKAALFQASDYGADQLAIAAIDSLKRNGTPEKALVGFTDKLWVHPYLLRALIGADAIKEKALAYLQDRAADMAGAAIVPSKDGGEVHLRSESQQMSGLADSSDAGMAHVGVESQAIDGHPASDPDERGAVQARFESHAGNGRSALTRQPGIPRGADAIAILNEQRFYQFKLSNGTILPDLYMHELNVVADAEDYFGRRNAWFCRRIAKYVANPKPGSRVHDYINAATFNTLLDEFKASNSKEIPDEK